MYVAQSNHLSAMSSLGNEELNPMVQELQVERNIRKIKCRKRMKGNSWRRTLRMTLHLALQIICEGEGIYMPHAPYLQYSHSHLQSCSHLHLHYTGTCIHQQGTFWNITWHRHYHEYHWHHLHPLQHWTSHCGDNQTTLCPYTWGASWWTQKMHVTFQVCPSLHCIRRQACLKRCVINTD